MCSPLSTCLNTRVRSTSSTKDFLKEGEQLLKTRKDCEKSCKVKLFQLKQHQSGSLTVDSVNQRSFTTCLNLAAQQTNQSCQYVATGSPFSIDVDESAVFSN